MARSIPAPVEPPSSLPITPTAERWARMSPAEREAFISETMAAIEAETLLMGEGVPHKRAKDGAQQVLGDWFSRAGRQIYVGSELNVLYPGEPVICPDVFAVLDVADPGEDDERTAWVVMDEGRGLDLALEVTFSGDRHKDLAVNVAKYARLGITEYFVFDRLKRRVLGYRLPSPGAAAYKPIPARAGTLASSVLGLELAVVGSKLRFFNAGAELPETAELLERLTTMADDLERRLEVETARAEAEARRAEDALQRLDAEARRADLEAQRRAELERQLAELLARRS